MPLIQMPRDVIRIINRFLYVVLGRDNEVCWGDLLGLQTIAIILPVVFRHIMENPGAYTGVDMASSCQPVSHQEHVNQFVNQRASALISLPDNTKTRAQRLLEELFPSLGNHIYDKLDQQQFSNLRRIAANDRLRIALTYDLPSDEVSQNDIELFFSKPESRDDVIHRVLDRNLLDRFLDVTLQKIDPSKIPDRIDFVRFLGKIVEEKKINSRFQVNRSLFYILTIDKITRLSDAVLLSASKDSDGSTALGFLVSDSSIPSLIAHLLARRLGKIENSYQQSTVTFMQTLASVLGNGFLQRWFNKTVAILRDKTFTEVADTSIIVKVLVSLQEGREQIPGLLQPYINSDKSIDAIADIFIGSEALSEEGTYIECENEYLRLLGDLDLICARAQSRLRDPLIQANIRLLAIYKSIVQQKKFYIENAEQVQD